MLHCIFCDSIIAHGSDSTVVIGVCERCERSAIYPANVVHVPKSEEQVITAGQVILESAVCR